MCCIGCATTPKEPKKKCPLCRKKIKLVVNDLVGVAKWLDYHKLTLNLDKTKCMLIGSNRKRQSKVDLTVSILDHSISSVHSFKYLGIHISSDFTWTDHIEHLTGKVNQRLRLLKRIKHLLPFRARLLFYKSLVMALFEYADLVWSDNFLSEREFTCRR